MSKYIELTSDQLQEKIDLLLNLWHAFIRRTVKAYLEECKRLKHPCDVLRDCNIEDIYCFNALALEEIFERTHQREDYFVRYHNGLQMSNFKEIGLVAFWITKLKPFSLKAEYFDDFLDFSINEEFALYYIFNTVARYAKKQNKRFNLKRINAELYNELLYSMHFRDISKEAYGCIVELIAIATIVDK